LQFYQSSSSEAKQQPKLWTRGIHQSIVHD
jgi:hypothetical protein